MYEVSFSKNFSRSLKKLLKSGSFKQDRLQSIIFLLSSKLSLPSDIKDHALKGNWSGYRECHIGSDLLLVYEVYDNYITFAYLGTHSELFGR